MLGGGWVKHQTAQGSEGQRGDGECPGSHFWGVAGSRGVRRVSGRSVRVIFPGPLISGKKNTVDGSEIRLNSPVEGTVVYPIIYMGFYTSQVVVWDF